MPLDVPDLAESLSEVAATLRGSRQVWLFSITTVAVLSLQKLESLSRCHWFIKVLKPVLVVSSPPPEQKHDCSLPR